MEARYQLALVGAALAGCSLVDATRAGGDPDPGPAGGADASAAAGDAALPCQLVDDFEDGVTGSLWVPFEDDDAAISEAGGALRVSFSGSDEAWGGYDLRQRIDLSHGEVRVAIAAAGGNYTGFDLCFGDMVLELYVEDGEGLIGEVYGTDSFDDSTEIVYLPAIHRVLRIRTAEGTVYWEVSETGGEWQTVHQQAAPFPLDDLLVTVQAGGDSSDRAAAFESFSASPTGCAQ